MTNLNKRREPYGRLKNFFFIIALLLVAGFSYLFFSKYEQQESPTLGVNIIQPSKPSPGEKTSDENVKERALSEQKKEKEQNNP